MQNKSDGPLTLRHIKVMNAILSKGERVEVIPIKGNEIRIYKIVRREAKTNENSTT